MSESGQSAYIEIAGLGKDAMNALRRNPPSLDEWGRILQVKVKTSAMTDQPAVIGRYAVEGATIRFVPFFPLDPGRQYEVTFEPARLPASAHDRTRPIAAVLALPGRVAAPTTVVSHVYPSGDIVPENQLRMYIHFSGPMGRRGGLDYVTLLDDRGQPVEDPFLPLDAELWDADRTRYTVFFDPGRQKRGILPNRTMGPSLRAGATYTLVVKREWPDANGQPLKGTFTRRFQVGPPDLQPLDQRSWTLDTPLAGTLSPLIVRFAEPLDHGLLMRALGVRRESVTLPGQGRVDAGETRWSFTPRDPWQPGEYEVFALSVLEDLAGNRIGRPFEVDRFERTDRSSDAQTFAVPFNVAGRVE